VDCRGQTVTFVITSSVASVPYHDVASVPDHENADDLGRPWARFDEAP